MAVRWENWKGKTESQQLAGEHSNESSFLLHYVLISFCPAIQSIRQRGGEGWAKGHFSGWSIWDRCLDHREKNCLDILMRQEVIGKEKELKSGASKDTRVIISLAKFRKCEPNPFWTEILLIHTFFRSLSTRHPGCYIAATRCLFSSVSLLILFRASGHYWNINLAFVLLLLLPQVNSNLLSIMELKLLLETYKAPLSRTIALCFDMIAKYIF